MKDTTDSEFFINGNGQQGAPEIAFQIELNNGLTLQLVKKAAEFDALKYEWEELVEASDAHIFQTFDWQRLWWKHFGGDNQLHIVTFRKDGNLIGIAPFFLYEKKLVYKLTYRRLRLIGCSIPSGYSIGTFANYSPTDYLDIIALPEFEHPVAKALLTYLKQISGDYDQIDFEETPEEGILMREVVPEMEKRKWPLAKSKLEICPKVNLPESTEEFLHRLKSKVRYEFRYSERAVTGKKLFRIETVDTPGKLLEAFDDFVRLHQKRWNRQGMPGAFADQRYTWFLREVAEAFRVRGWLCMKTARKNDECLAVDFAFAFNNKIYDYQKAFDDRSDLIKYSPGRAVLFCIIDEAIQSGFTQLDCLRGNEKYKLRISNCWSQNWKVTVSSTSEMKDMKYKMYATYSTVANFYMRLARESLLIKTHIKEMGALKFMPSYYRFLYGRIAGKISN